MIGKFDDGVKVYINLDVYQTIDTDYYIAL